MEIRKKAYGNSIYDVHTDGGRGSRNAPNLLTNSIEELADQNMVTKFYGRRIWKPPRLYFKMGFLNSNTDRVQGDNSGLIQVFVDLKCQILLQYTKTQLKISSQQKTVSDQNRYRVERVT